MPVDNVLTVVGIEKVNYQSKRTGNQVTGIKLHYTEPRNNVEGYAVDTAYLNNMIDISKLVVGSKVRLFYNRYNQVSMLSIVE